MERSFSRGAHAGRPTYVRQRGRAPGPIALSNAAHCRSVGGWSGARGPPGKPHHRMNQRPLTTRPDGAEQSSARRGTDGIKDDLARQLTLMAHRSTPYRRLVPQIAALLDHPVHGRAVLASMQRAWRNREFRAYYERPLLLFAALRSDALGDGPSHPLHAALRDSAPDADTITEASLSSALDPTRTGLWTTL